MTAISIKTGVWKLSDIYDKINFGLTYSADDTPIPSGPQAGTLWVWGSSTDGALGDSTAIPKSSPVQIPGTQWVEMSTGCKFNIARKSDCTIWTWGNNGYGQSGVGDTSPQRSSPIQVPGTSWTCVSAGENSNFALKSDNTLWAWGSNRFGRLGTNSYGYSPKSSPFQIPGTNWVSVSSSAWGVAFARKSDGTLWGWGGRSSTYGDIGENANIRRSSPVQIPGTSWIDVKASGFDSSTLARKSN